MLVRRIGDILGISLGRIVHLSIAGEPASKANSRRIIRISGKIKSIKSLKALSYADAFKMQCKKISPPLDGDLFMHVVIHYASRRPDLDESMILDLLQSVVYHNDRQVKVRLAEWRLDRGNPRADITIAEIAP